MAGLTKEEAKKTLDWLFPISGATDYIGYSINGIDEFNGLARTFIGASGWAPASSSLPIIKTNNAIFTTEEASASGVIRYIAIFSDLGIQRTNWSLLEEPKNLNIGDILEFPIGIIKLIISEEEG